MSYAFAPPKALAALIIFAAHQRQANKQNYDSYNKINGKVIYIIHLLIRPSFFPPQSAGRIRAIYIFFLSAPFAMLVYNPLVKYERGSSSTACALRRIYLLYYLLTISRTITAYTFTVCIIIFGYKITYKKRPACSVLLL